MPPFGEYEAYLQDIWQRQWLTNNGPLVNELELRLKEYLGVPYLLYVTNGTIALQLAIQALELKGEIITTPFSYIATTSSILWENCKPVFVDIDAATFNIDPQKIEAAITSKTSGILATHVYGNPCAIDAIDAIAKKHGLKVVYDAAHCFGTQYKGKSVFMYGDITTTSFHATKLFHTIEGGAVFSQDIELLKRVAYMRNFGFNGPEDFACLGINGKNSEFHAAMGLVNLKYADAILSKRKELFLYYNQQLQALCKQQQSIEEHTLYNYSHYPVVFPSEAVLKRMMEQLYEHLIFPRRYFYPALHSLNFVEQQECPVCSSISSRVLCLPLYHDITKEEIDTVARVLLSVQNN